jgi:hypothetical protein
MKSVCTSIFFYFVFLLLATSFGLSRPSTDQYLQKNLKILVHIAQNLLQITQLKAVNNFILMDPCIVV